VIEPCKYCQSQRVAAVLDKQIEARPTAGNKYRKRCLDCGRWLPCCSTADFQAADRQHVLPRGVDRESENPTVPVEEFGGDVDGLQSADSGGTDTAVTDGGPETTADNSDSDGDDANRFDCPKCGDSVTGQPDECPHCGAGYKWE